MPAVLTYILGPFIALLPTRRAKPLAERLGINLYRAAVVSGLAELILCVGFLVAWYFIFSHSFVEKQMAAFMRGQPQNPKDMVMFSYGLSTAVILAYYFHPLTLTLVFFSAEGFLRGLAALLAEDHVGTLPLVLINLVGEKVHGRAVQMREPPIPDVVSRGGEKDDWQLRIESCRPRRWDKLTTIGFEDQLYELAAKFEGTPPRPFIYVLRHLPPHKVVRGIYHYSPDEVLRPDFESSQTMKV